MEPYLYVIFALIGAFVIWALSKIFESPPAAAASTTTTTTVAAPVDQNMQAANVVRYADAGVRGWVTGGGTW